MIKKLLNQILNTSSYDNERKKIEKYLSGSKDLADLENRMRELDKKGSYNKFYI
jgi:signal recognition particle GTPase